MWRGFKKHPSFILFSIKTDDDSGGIEYIMPNHKQCGWLINSDTFFEMRCIFNDQAYSSIHDGYEYAKCHRIGEFEKFQFSIRHFLLRYIFFYTLLKKKLKAFNSKVDE